MDNIEYLISDADPAKRHNIGSAGPLQEPGPVFSQTSRSIGTNKRSRGWRIFAAATTVVAATAGIVVWAPWEAPNATDPAGHTTLVPEDPTEDPSQSASTDDY